jgi:hypothetical protein
MAVLQSGGIIKVNTRREMTHDGIWRTTDVEIEFTDKIFQILDLIPEFLSDREYQSVKFHEKQQRLDKNRAKKNLYRKPSFRPSNKVIHNHTKDLQSLTKKLTKPYKPTQSGRGVQIRHAIQKLLDKGVSLPVAIEAVKKLYPPPH